MTNSLSPLDRLLTMHEQRTGHRPQRSGNSYRISCGACATESRKVAVTEASNRSVLLHAFCGHSPDEVLDAIGLQMSDLFVQRDLRTMTPAERNQLRVAMRTNQCLAAIEVLTREATVILIAANKLSDGDPLTNDEMKRTSIAAMAVFDAHEVLANAR